VLLPALLSLLAASACRRAPVAVLDAQHTALVQAFEGDLGRPRLLVLASPT
jgi:hypothetical protein